MTFRLDNPELDFIRFSVATAKGGKGHPAAHSPPIIGFKKQDGSEDCHAMRTGKTYNTKQFNVDGSARSETRFSNLATSPMMLTIAYLVLNSRPLDVRIQKPPDSLSYNGFYSKCAYFQGLPILGSSQVDDRAFQKITDTFGKMLRRTPHGTVAALVSAGCHYSIIAAKEGQTDLPEYADLRNDPKTDWNKRARGLGGKFTSGGEENILEFPDDRYKGESIYIHEFAHTLDEFAFSKLDPQFVPDITDAYSKAMSEGLWKNTYSTTNRFEYFAEGVQMYFDCARIANPPNGVHNEVGNREALKRYDPRLFAVVDREFGHNPWRYQGTYNKTRLPLPPDLNP